MIAACDNGYALRLAIIAEARSWMETPFRHQGRVKGPRGGVDCANLVIAVGQNTGAWAIDERVWRKFEPYYGRRPNPEKMRQAMIELGLVPIAASEATIGDLAWSHWGDEAPIHMSILSEHEGRRIVIHAIWNDAVRDQTVDRFFEERISEYWRYPALAGR